VGQDAGGRVEHVVYADARVSSSAGNEDLVRLCARNGAGLVTDGDRQNPGRPTLFGERNPAE
jgi:molybdopterin biosynthesis enzyme